MSSHHIIREKQEPALYVHRLGDFHEDYLGQMLEWSPTLIVNETEYDKALSLGLKVDLVVAKPAFSTLQEDTGLIPESDNALHAVLNHLAEAKYPAVNIIGAEVELHELEAFLDKLNIVLFTARDKAYAVKSGFKIWKPGGQLFALRPVAGLQVSNLKACDDRYEVETDGFVEFHFNAPYLFITEQL
ncbi:thiamine pyrophosphokinase [Pedobacter deserti]|uniref:thiamine pyrophosphokinase n=1 Tax=Pedobacter deserti TaxID=2817382 RepID=UPI00210B38D5|nr:thiamine pyrophosphokinase [Pedobacter sp. SYSU D00382]